MKLVKNFVFAVLLVSAIAVNTSAGEQETPGYAPPPPPNAMRTDGETIISNPEQAEGATAETPDYLFLEALAALLSVY